MEEAVGEGVDLDDGEVDEGAEEMSLVLSVAAACEGVRLRAATASASGIETRGVEECSGSVVLQQDNTVKC